VREPLPEPGPPFRAGDEVAFFPAEVSTAEDPGKLLLEYVVIDDVNDEAETFSGHFLSAPGDRFSQDVNNIVRRSPTYNRWRLAMEQATRAGHPLDDHEEKELRLRVLAEHPIHGGARFPHPLVGARRAAESSDISRR
jgi:hypothetical protein